MKTCYLTGAAYVLGETEMNYTEAQGFAESKMPNKPDLWGWGSYYKTKETIFDLMTASVMKTFERTPIEPQSIDAVIFCSMNFPGQAQDGAKFVRNFLEAFDLSKAYPIGITLNGCNTLLSGIDMAKNMIAAGKLEHILVVAGDAIDDEGQRFQQYGIFSDAASSCVATAQPSSGYEIVRSVFATDYQAMFNDASFSTELAISVGEKIFEDMTIGTEDITAVFCNNIFIPITSSKELDVGFEDEQLYLKNVKRISHCFSSDPLINLIDYSHEVAVKNWQYFMLNGDSPGLRSSILLRAASHPNTQSQGD
jgi:3-oxoacyl-[acyl-carrier-protein] synthase-3